MYGKDKKLNLIFCPFFKLPFCPFFKVSIPLIIKDLKKKVSDLFEEVIIQCSSGSKITPHYVNTGRSGWVESV